MRKFFTVAVLVVPAALFTTSTFAADKPKRDPEELFKRLDTNNDGSLTETELIGKRTGDKADKAKAAFAKLDKDKDGKVTLDEYKAGGKKTK